MEMKEMTVQELEERKQAIASEIEIEGADLDALETETKSINAELEARKAEEAQKVETRAAVTEGAGEVVAEFKEEKREMKTSELQKSTSTHLQNTSSTRMTESAEHFLLLTHQAVFLFLQS